MKKYRSLLDYSLAIFVSVLSGVLWIPILTRILTQDQYGHFALLNQTFLTFSAITMIGTFYIQTTMNLIPNYKSIIRYMNFVVVVLVGLISLSVLQMNLLESILLAILLFVYAIFQNNMVLLNIQNNSRGYSRGQTIFSVLKIIFSISLILIFPRAIFVIVGMTMALLLSNLLINNQDDKTKINFTPKLSEIKEIISIGSPLVTFSFLYAFFTFVDIYFLKTFTSNKTVALYSSYFTLILSLFSIPLSVITLYLIPKYRNRIKPSNNLLVAITLNVCNMLFFIIIYAFGGEIIFSVLLPENYSMSLSYIIGFVTIAFLMNLLRQFSTHYQFTNFKLYSLLLITLSVVIVLKYLFYHFIEVNIGNIIGFNIFTLTISNFIFFVSLKIVKN